MYKIGYIKTKKKLTRSNVERELQDKGFNGYDLAKYYITGFKRFNSFIKSDLRTDDYKGSMMVRIQKDKLVISDFGLKTGLNIYNYLIEKHFLNHKHSFLRALDLIRENFNLTNIEHFENIKYPKYKKPIHYNEIIKDSSLPVKIEVKRRRRNGKVYWTKKDINYWNSYGIPIDKLEEKGIAPLEAFWITNYNKTANRLKYNTKDDLCYVYPFFRDNEGGHFMYKIYLPKGYRGNTDLRWISNVNKKVITNIQNVPKSGELLIVQSSYKDTILMETLKPELNIIAPNGEGIWFKPEVWQELRKNWKHIVLFANNDFTKENNPGLTFARRYSSLYNIPFISTPNTTASDISDFHQRYGKKKTIEFLDKCLENIKLIT